MGSTVSRPPSRLRLLYGSTVGKKAVMALTGVVLLLFVIAHMIGNLGIFAGAEAIDAYGRWLRELGGGSVLWALRVGLLVSVVLHVTTAVALTRRARAARPRGYAHRTPVAGGIAARTMRWGGVTIAVFVVYHLLDLTFGVLNPHGVHGEIHRNVTASLRRGTIAVTYCVAVIVLGLHIRHGAWSALQSLGVAKPVHRKAALAIAVAITGGFLLVPLAVMTGLVR